MGGSPSPSLLEATNNTTGQEGETFTSQPDSSVCRESDWYVEQCLVLSLTAITIPVRRWWPKIRKICESFLPRKFPAKRYIIPVNTLD